MHRTYATFAAVAVAVVGTLLLAQCLQTGHTDERSNSLQAQERASSQWLAHNVYFSLKDQSPQAKAKLVEACHKYLSGHEGTLFFAAGVLADDLNRPVNDREFDVALHIVFKDKAAHDRYQEHPRHKQFIEENQANWKKVRVFDSYVSPKP